MGSDTVHHSVTTGKTHQQQKIERWLQSFLFEFWIFEQSNINH